MDVADGVRRINTIRATANSMVINLPPDKNGKLVEGDKNNLFEIAKKAGIYRELSD